MQSPYLQDCASVVIQLEGGRTKSSETRGTICKYLVILFCLHLMAPGQNTCLFLDIVGVPCVCPYPVVIDLKSVFAKQVEGELNLTEFLLRSVISSFGSDDLMTN